MLKPVLYFVVGIIALTIVATSFGLAAYYIGVGVEWALHIPHLTVLQKLAIAFEIALYMLSVLMFSTFVRWCTTKKYASSWTNGVSKPVHRNAVYPRSDA